MVKVWRWTWVCIKHKNCAFNNSLKSALKWKGRCATTPHFMFRGEGLEDPDDLMEIRIGKKRGEHSLVFGTALCEE